MGFSSLVDSVLSRKRFFFYLLAALCLALYVRTATFGFTYLDDDLLIVSKKALLTDVSRAGELFARDAFMQDKSGIYRSPLQYAYYRPLLSLSFMLDAQLSGVSPVIYHCTNIILHLAAAFLLYLFLLRLSYSPGLSAGATMLFAVHPTLARAVAWIPGRNDSLLAIFVLLSFMLCMDYAKKGRRRHLFLHVLAFIFALLTKETALFLVPLMAGYLFFFMKKDVGRRQWAALGAGWAVSAGVWVLLRSVGLRGATDIIATLDVSQVPVYFVKYLGLALFPHPLTAFSTNESLPIGYGIAALIAVTALFALCRQCRRDRIVFGAAWFAAMLAPTFFMRAEDAVYFEHRLYLPLIGLVIAGCEAAGLFLKGRKGRAAVFGVLFVVFASRAYSFSGVFKDRGVFWRNAVSASPHSPIAHHGLGGYYLSVNDLDGSASEFKWAASYSPIAASNYMWLGMIYSCKGNNAEAERYFRMSLHSYPPSAPAFAYYGRFCYRNGREREAVQCWERALRIKPGFPDACWYLARYYEDHGDRENAEKYRAIARGDARVQG